MSIETKKKPMPIILKNGLNDNNNVQMAQRLYMQLRHADLSLTELKLIDVYLSRINSHNPNAREVVFDKGELEKLFGVTRIHNAVLDRCFDKLMQISVIVTSNQEDDDTITTHKKSFTLFNEAILIQDKKDGMWKVHMQCGDEAAELIFNIDKIGYLQHTIRDTAHMSNRNTFLVYKFIESRRMNKKPYPQSFTIDIADLREQLNCTDKYKNFQDFNKCILKAAQKDIQDNTSTRFTYKVIYAHRFASKIKFTIMNKHIISEEAVRPTADIPTETSETIDLPIEAVPSPVLPVDAEIVSNGKTRYHYGNSYDTYMETHDGNDDMYLISNELVAELAAACCNEFSPTQMRSIIAILTAYSSDKRELFEYLSRRYTKFDMKSQSTAISNRFSYFYAMIENDKEQGLLGDFFF